jgi:hypothetical protein
VRHTPYAANEDEAKDYELDRVEREQEITQHFDEQSAGHKASQDYRKHMKRMLEHAKRILSNKPNPSKPEAK